MADVEVEDDETGLRILEIFGSLLLNMEIAGEIAKQAVVDALSGPPGGDALQIGDRTGALVASMEAEVDPDPLQPGFVVRCTDPTQAPILARLVGGFVGADALGRTYDEAPKPVIEAAFLLVQDAIIDAVGSKLSLLQD